MPRISIRAGTADDFALLPDLEARSDQSYLTLPGFGALLDEINITDDAGPDTEPGTLLFIAESDAPIGFVYAYDTDDCTFISQIAVVPEAQKHGAGTALLQAIANAAQQAGKRGVTLMTYRDVPWNAPFYAKRGYNVLTPAEMGPELSARFARDVTRWSKFGERCAMGLFF